MDVNIAMSAVHRSIVNLESGHAANSRSFRNPLRIAGIAAHRTAAVEMAMIARSENPVQIDFVDIDDWWCVLGNSP